MNYLFVIIFFIGSSLFGKVSIQSSSNDVETVRSSKILSDYLNKINITVDGKYKEVNFVVGKLGDSVVKALSMDLAKMKNDAYTIQTRNHTIYIIGNNDRSVRYGIYAFLESLGCRFFTADFEVIPKKAILHLNTIEQISEARFHYREIFIKEADDDEYAIKNRLNGHLGHRTKDANPLFIRTFNEFSPFNLVSKMYQKIFPDYFCNGQLDFSLHGTSKIAGYKALDVLEKKNPVSGDQVYLSHEDVASYCTSSSSNRLIRKYNSPSAPFVFYAQHIAKRIGEKYPDVKVFLEAYQWSRKAPKNYPKLSKNMGIFFSDIEADFFKPLNSIDNIEIYKDLKSWKKVSNDIYVWHYITNFSGYLQPFPDFHATAKDMQLFDKMPFIRGIFLQGAYNSKGSELANMRIWVFSKLLWNPKLDVDSLISEFCHGYYGAAANDVLAYLKLLDKTVRETNSKLFVKTSLNSPYLNNTFLHKARQILQNAQRKVLPNSIYEKHLLKLFSGIDYIMLMKGSIDEKGKIRFRKFLSSYKVSSYSEGGNTKELVKMLKMDRCSPIPPTSIKAHDKWLDFQDFTLRLCCSEIVKDKNASDFIAVRMKGNRSDWGIQLPLKELPVGKWKIYANVRVKKANNSIADKVYPAIFYGIYGKNIKDGKLLVSLSDEKFHEVFIGTVTVKHNDPAVVWIRPPNNKAVAYIYVDRIFAIEAN